MTHAINKEFNDFFLNMGSDLAKKILVDDNMSLDNFYRRIILIHCS